MNCLVNHDRKNLQVQRINYNLTAYNTMVMPLVDEDKPKCYICHDMFDDFDKLRIHHKKEHNSDNLGSGPSPGDVTAF